MITIEQLKNVIADDIHQLSAELLNSYAERIALDEAVGRILSQDIVSPINIPSESVSAMDGYGLHLTTEELCTDAPLDCIGESIAGKAFIGEVKAGQCIRIMTGALVPPSVNAVVMQEDTSYIDGEKPKKINLLKPARKGSNIRHKGEEIKQNTVVMPTGTLIDATDIPLLASVGCYLLDVYLKLSVGIFSTGDELCDTAKRVTAGKIYDANRPALKAILERLPVVVHDYGIIRDDLATIKKALTEAAEENDIVVTSGGVSVGDYDFLKTAVDEVGDIIQYKVALKPGKPFVYGRIGRARYFGLPGNPLSSVLSAKLFLVPAIYQYFGINTMPVCFGATLQTPIQRNAGRAELQRGIAEQSTLGKWSVSVSSPQDSHRVYQLSQANALIYLPDDCTNLNVGDRVIIMPLNEQLYEKI